MSVMDLDVEKLKVAELREELESRGHDSRGTKEVLKERLIQILQDNKDEARCANGASADEHQPEKAENVRGATSDLVTAGDSVSQTSRTTTSSVLARRAEEAATRAELEVKLRLMKEKQKVKREMARMQEEEELLEMEEALQISKAREQVWNEQVALMSRASPRENLDQVGASSDNLQQRAIPRLIRDTAARSATTSRHEAAAVPQQEGARAEARSRMTMQQGTVAVPHQDASRAEARSRTTLQQEVVPHQDATRAEARRRTTLRQEAVEVQHPDGVWTEARNRTPLLQEAVEVQHQDGARTRLQEEAARYSRRLKLPPLELTTFRGDSSKFKPFMKSFEHNIASNLDHEAEKLLYLLKFTAGKPREIVQTCVHLPDGLGYTRAVELLHRRYDNHVQTVANLMERMRELPVLRPDDGEGLDDFSIYLRGCLNAFESLPHASESTDARIVLQLLEKLPYSMVDRWRRMADKVEQEKRRPANFRDLVEFLEDEARIATNPTYGRHMTSRLKGKKNETKENDTTRRIVRGKAMAGSIHPTGTCPLCLFCGAQHALEVCRQFEHKTTPVERSKFVKERGLCFACLKPGHRSRFCKNKMSCRKCNMLHPTVLHEDRTQPSTATPPSRTTSTRPASPPTTATTGHIASTAVEGGAKLQSVKVQARFLGKAVNTRAFLDTGSTHSFISRQLVEKLGIKPHKKTTVVLSTVNGAKKLDSSMVQRVRLGTLDGGEDLELPALYVLDEIYIAREDLPSNQDVEPWDYLVKNGVCVEGPSEGEDVGLLIGANAAWVMEPIQVVNSEDGGPYAVRTRYGWVLGGIEKRSNFCRVNRIRVLDPMAEELFENRADTSRGLSVEDVKWCSQMESGWVKKEKYEIKLPFRDPSPALENNRCLAEKRLQLLKRKFERDRVYCEEYTARIDKLLKDGHAEEAPDGVVGSGVWYLPHFSVRHPTKDSLRVVFDCAAKYRGLSLNDTLLQGPDLTTPLTDVLIRFRENPYAFTGDIESMFLQVSVPECQRDFLRFLWWPRGITGPVREYRMTVHLFGATSSPSCANFALHRTAEDNGAHSSEAKETIRKNFYVDDVLKSVESEAVAVKLLDDLKRLCAEGGFHLTKFSSNSVKVLRSVSREERANTVKDLTLGSDSLPVERALGVLWDTDSDTIGFQVDVNQLERKPMTKRGMLSAAASCYDPLGLIAPCIVKARIIVQELHRLELDWDDSVPGSQQREWGRWLKDLHSLSLFRIPRCLCTQGLDAALGDGGRIELHHFADASTKAYGVVSYVRTVGEEVSSRLLFSKARLAPMKPVSVPRMELAAATLAVKTNMELERSLDTEVKVFYWTDSTTVLKYIRNVKTRFHVFVANRLAVIHDGSEVDQWKYVPTDCNPADLVSRGAAASSLINCDLWKCGPAFLQSAEECWPRCPDDMHLSTADPEVKTAEPAEPSLSGARSSFMAAVVVAPDVAPEAVPSPVQKLLQHYSTWKRLIRAVALLRRCFSVLRYRCSLKSFVKPEDEPRSLMICLTPTDLTEAELCVARDVQKRHFEEEIADLRAGKPVRSSSRLSRLSPVLEDDLIRLGGRLRNSELSGAVRHPVILPNKDRSVDLMIEAAHTKVGHEGRQHVMAEIGESYWVLGCNSAVRRVLSRCVSCRRRQRPPESQLMADLPEDRVRAGEKPFACTGVDYFGPFFVRRGRSQVKKYGIIFTCLAVRAVHIEVADSLSSDSFLCALRRFVARRGDVRLLRSDQGTNFKGAERKLREEVSKLCDEEDAIQRAALDMKIEWKFNPPLASHFGGAWERQIRTVRKILGALMSQQSFTDETLHTLLCEVECVLNNRPLTPVSMDSRDQLPISPNHLLHLKCVTFPAGDEPGKAPPVGRNQLRQAAYLAEQFWRRWRREYLPLLQVRTGPTTRSRANVGRGDIVLLVDDSIPRGVWPMGRVEEALAGADGKVRTVRVRARGTTYMRPITKIVKIVEAPEC